MPPKKKLRSGDSDVTCLYHIAKLNFFEKAKKLHEPYVGSDDETKDGYLHLSPADLISRVANLFYAAAAAKNRVLLRIDPAQLDEGTLKWEDVPFKRSDEEEEQKIKFPHVYGSIPLKAIKRADNMKNLKGNDGAFDLTAAINAENDASVLNSGEFVWHLARQSDWAAALAAGSYNGSAECQSDGFIHLSAHSELEESARRHRPGEEGLLLLKVHTERLGDKLKWEWVKSRQACFAHIFGTLDPAAVEGTWPLPVDSATRLHVFPAAFYAAAE